MPASANLASKESMAVSSVLSVGFGLVDFFFFFLVASKSPVAVWSSPSTPVPVVSSPDFIFEDFFFFLPIPANISVTSSTAGSSCDVVCFMAVVLESSVGPASDIAPFSSIIVSSPLNATDFRDLRGASCRGEMSVENAETEDCIRVCGATVCVVPRTTSAMLRLFARRYSQL